MFVRSAHRPFVLHSKILTVNITRKLINQYLLIPAMLLGTIDFYHFAWGSQGQVKAKPIGFIFSHPFHLIRMKFDVVMKQPS